MPKCRANGEGCVRKRSDGRWEGIVVIGKKDNGTPIRKSVFAKTQRDLIVKLRNTITQYDCVSITEASNITLAEWIDRWFDKYTLDLHPGTINGYRKISDKICAQLGDTPIRRITMTDVQKSYNIIKKSGRIQPDEENGTTLSDSYVRKMHMWLHEVMEAAVKERLIATNPTNGTVVPKNNYQDKNILSTAEVEKFIDAIEKEPLWFDFFYTEITTGLRRGEICALKWSDLDEERGILYVKRSLSRGANDKLEIGETKTETGKRKIKLPQSTLEYIIKRKENSRSEWIFPSLLDPSKPISPNAAYSKLKVILKKADLPNIRFHDLRHTFATHALTSGVDAKTLSGILGHTNASFTLDTYTHMTTEMQRNAAEKVGTFMESIFGKELKPWEMNEEKKAPEL